ncbi:histone-lysine N-methyltransferase SETMAR [Plakobranchus ocellatus]|uniref:Histone-lysine N-methyltransferase SETMAR n=1 Tax=Plakobranchus ocellatus TaxID=259542 RepID=A0AAV4DKF8_9GAST|nr:histone-lysine N-methyltransferase SETMAR [Plakobranchus ocellatus]
MHNHPTPRVLFPSSLKRKSQTAFTRSEPELEKLPAPNLDSQGNSPVFTPAIIVSNTLYKAEGRRGGTGRAKDTS